jgi:hypothetical protein
VGGMGWRGFLPPTVVLHVGTLLCPHLGLVDRWISTDGWCVTLPLKGKLASCVPSAPGIPAPRVPLLLSLAGAQALQPAPSQQPLTQEEAVLGPLTVKCQLPASGT